MESRAAARYKRRMLPSGSTAVRVEVVTSAALTPASRERIFVLFAAAYRDADASYLDESLARLRHVSLAYDGDDLVAFGLGEARIIDLPRLPRTLVRMAGIACVAPGHRRQRIMVEVMQRAITHGAPDASPALVAGRMAHPATFRLMAAMPSALPRLGVTPTAWQQAIGATVADAYGARAFDPLHFVCRGRGTPIGHPAVAIEATAEEWALFAPVDRRRGDSLLGIAWLGAPPAGW